MTRSAAFVRVEQILLDGHDLSAALYAAANAPGLGQRLGRLGSLLVAAPALGALGWRDRRLSRRAAGLAYRGLGEDRLELVGREFYDRFLSGRLRQTGLDLVRRLQADEHQVVLVSAGLEVTLAPLKARLGLDVLVGSQLELRDGVATGKLIEARQGAWWQALAAERGLALGASYAYGSDLDDEALLRAVGFPCAANPDARLRQLASAQGWPVLELGPGAATSEAPANPAAR
jgi:phosphoserine phosphatase